MTDRLEYLRGVGTTDLLDILRRAERTLTVLTIPSMERIRSICIDPSMSADINNVLRDLWNVSTVIYNTINAHDGYHIT